MPSRKGMRALASVLCIIPPTHTCCLRVRPESLRAIAKFSEHEADGGEAKKSQGAEIEIFPILRQAAATI